MRHVGVREIVGDGVDAGLWDDLAQLVFLRHSCSPRKTYSRSAKRGSTKPRSFGGPKQKRPAVRNRLPAFINMGIAAGHAGRSGGAPLVRGGESIDLLFLQVFAWRVGHRVSPRPSRAGVRGSPYCE